MPLFPFHSRFAEPFRNELICNKLHLEIQVLLKRYYRFLFHFHFIPYAIPSNGHAVPSMSWFDVVIIA